MSVYDKAREERIKALNRELDPFYLMEGSDGRFSLCARMNYMDEEFGQAAFDAYAESIGEDPRDEQGYITYGSGYDWAAAFKEAFKDDPNLKRIHFDCEGSGFFCDGDDLEMMADFGKRFRELSLDTERFTPIVSAGIKNEAIQMAEEERLSHTVRGYVMKHQMAEFHVLTAQGYFKLGAGEGRKLLSGVKRIVPSFSNNVELTAEEFLDLKVTDAQQDLFDKNLFKLMAEQDQEELLAPTLKL